MFRKHVGKTWDNEQSVIFLDNFYSDFLNIIAKKWRDQIINFIGIN